MIVDERLLATVKKAVQGDGQALEYLCEEKAQNILFSAMNILKNRTDAEDAAQEAILKLRKGIGSLKQPEYFDVWLYRIILNECRNLKRKEPKWEQADENSIEQIQEDRAEFLPQEYAEDREKRSHLMEIIKKLRPKYKEAILMRYYEDMSYAEIAEVMGVSPTAVGTTLRRAQGRIKMELERIEAHSSEAYSMKSFAAVPVLTQALRMSAEEVFPRAGMHAFVTGCETAGAEAGATAAAAKAAGAKAAGTKAAGGLLTGKTVSTIVAVAAVCVVIAVPVLEKNGILTAITDDPTPSSASNVPQTDEMLPEEGLEILNVPSAGPDSTGSAEDVSLIGFAVTGELHGSVKLKDKDGNVVTGVEPYLAGLPVTITGEGGEVLRQTATNANGRFSFEGSLDEKYQVSVDLEGSHFAAAVYSTEEGVRPDVERDGETGEVTVYVKKRYTPDFIVMFASAACDCGHVNPDSALALCNDLPGTTFTWQVTGSDGSVILTGDGQECMAPTWLLEDEAYGTYTVEWTAVDIAGYETLIKRVFKIVKEPVDPRLYA